MKSFQFIANISILTIY